MFPSLRAPGAAGSASEPTRSGLAAATLLELLAGVETPIAWSSAQSCRKSLGVFFFLNRQMNLESGMISRNYCGNLVREIFIYFSFLLQKIK